MSTINKDFAAGGANMNPGANAPTLAVTLQDIADDLATLKAKINATNAKLDADAGVTDTNYAALNNVGTLKTLKGTT